MRTLFVIIFLLPVLSGCVIKQSANIPGARGRFVDAGSGQPLAGISVVRQPPGKAVVSTKSDGTFLLEPDFGFQLHWIVPPVATVHRVTSRLEFVARGYESQVITNVSVKGNSVPTDLHTIELRRSTN
jgi:hypothetical protein